MAAGRKTGGRKKGTPNKMTMAAKEAIAYAAEGLGGADRMVAWAKEDPANEKAFWSTIYPKLLPVQVANEDGQTFKTEEVGKGARKLEDYLDAIARREAGGPAAE